MQRARHRKLPNRIALGGGAEYEQIGFPSPRFAHDVSARLDTAHAPKRAITCAREARGDDERGFAVGCKFRGHEDAAKLHARPHCTPRAKHRDRPGWCART